MIPFNSPNPKAEEDQQRVHHSSSSPSSFSGCQTPLQSNKSYFCFQCYKKKRWQLITQKLSFLHYPSEMVQPESESKDWSVENFFSKQLQCYRNEQKMQYLCTGQIFQPLLCMSRQRRSFKDRPDTRNLIIITLATGVRNIDVQMCICPLKNLAISLWETKERKPVVKETQVNAL